MSKKRKLKPEEKADIVRGWQAGEISIHAASQSAGVDPKTIRRWITRYEEEGNAGFLPREQNRVYPPELKRQAVKEYLSGAGSLWKSAKSINYEVIASCASG